MQGPLKSSRSPQGQPVIIQAGSSDPGQELAARSADVVFTARTGLAEARACHRGLKDARPATAAARSARR
ncbi:hypothetical protein [Xanthobacter cornucopiae]|uniref:hypothetical protein n=1 Tax=Xanthobacter cornucopiae TaxID=3119924 RepID=UPI00372D0617